MSALRLCPGRTGTSVTSRRQGLFFYMGGQKWFRNYYSNSFNLCCLGCCINITKDISVKMVIRRLRVTSRVSSAYPFLSFLLHCCSGHQFLLSARHHTHGSRAFVRYYCSVFTWPYLSLIHPTHPGSVVCVFCPRYTYSRILWKVLSWLCCIHPRTRVE